MEMNRLFYAYCTCTRTNVCPQSCIQSCMCTLYMYMYTVHAYTNVQAYTHTQDISVDGLLGHQFVQRRMQKPSSCSACEEIIWQDGIACQSKFVYMNLCHLVCQYPTTILWICNVHKYTVYTYTYMYMYIALIRCRV